jgi:hypothetical protein
MTVVESLAKKEKPKRSKVQCAMDEIIVSEQNYLMKLKELVEEIIKPCTKSDLFGPAEIATLFGNIQKLKEYHENFSLELTQVDHVDDLTKVMDEHLPLMEPIYNQYCSNFPLATKYYAEMTKIPYRSTTLTPSGTLRRGDSATLRAPSTLNREIATSSMSLRASVRHSKLFDSPLRLRNVLSPKKNIFDSSKAEKPTANQKERKSAIPKKIRRRHSAHYRDADCENSDSSSLSESSSDEKSLSPPTIAPPSGGNKYNSLKIKRRVKKSLSAPNCTSGHPECISGCSIDSPALKIDFINACLQRSKSLNTGLPLPAHLLEPVQRVMRYTILLKTLRNHLADEIDKAQSDPPQTDQSDRTSESDESEDSFDGSLSSLHSYCPSSLKYVDLAIERSKKLAHSTNYYQPTHNLQPTQKPPPPTQPTRRLNRNSLSISYTTATLLRQKVNSKSETADLAEEKKSRRRSFERFKNAAENFLRGR